MMMKYVLSLYYLLAFAFLSSCTHVAKIDSVKMASSLDIQVRREMLVGKWYAENPTKEGQIRKSLIERRLDGTFTVQFQLYENEKKVLDQVEAGYWGISNYIYFTITREMLSGVKFRPVDTKNATFYDGYNILELTHQFFRYTSLETSTEYIVERVPSNFKLPR